MSSHSAHSPSTGRPSSPANGRRVEGSKRQQDRPAKNWPMTTHRGSKQCPARSPMRDDGRERSPIRDPAMTASTKPSSENTRRTRRRLVVVGVVLAAAIGFLLFKTLSSAIVYFKTAQEAVANRASLGNSTFQMEGVVVPHSIHHASGGVLDFVISSGTARVPVENEGAPPQLFQPNIAVVLVGHFVGSSDLCAA